MQVRYKELELGKLVCLKTSPFERTKLLAQFTQDDTSCVFRLGHKELAQQFQKNQKIALMSMKSQNIDC